MEDKELEKLKRRKLAELMKRVSGGGKKRVVDLNSRNFDDFISKSDKPVLVDFWASWCAPCMYMHPIVEKMASKYGGKMEFARVNVDKNLELARRFNITGIPTFIVFVNGKPKGIQVGAMPEDSFERFIKKFIE